MNTKFLLQQTAKEYLGFQRFLLVITIMLFASFGALAQTVTTDKDDYLPGDVVQITGDGWQAGEQVKLVIDHSTVTHGNTVLYATADDDGHIFNDQYVIQEYHLGESFVLLATGGSSGNTAQATFTDGNAKDGDGTFVLSSTNSSICSGSTGNSFTFQFRAKNGGDWMSGSQATLLIPSSWPMPKVSPAGAANVSVTGVGITVSSYSISTTNSNLLIINFYGSGGTNNGFNVVYGTVTNKVTAPSVNTNSVYNFIFKTAQSGGTLIGLSSPSITVNSIPTAPTASSNSPVIAGSTLNLSASIVSGASYSWTGPNGFTSSLQNPSISDVTGAASGTYSVIATVGGCTSIAGTINVIINPAQAQPAITWPDAGTITYGTNLTNKLNAVAKVNNVEVAGTYAYKQGSDIVTSTTILPYSASAHALTVTFTPTDATKYKGATGENSIVVNKAELVVTADNKSKTYDGQAFTNFTSKITGYINNETESVITGSVTYSGEATSATDYRATAYNVSPVVSGLRASNYSFKSANGGLTINKADAQVAITPYSGTYDAAAHTASGTASGVNGADLNSNLRFATSYTNAPGGNTAWSFDGGTNYNNENGTTAVTINKATPIISLVVGDAPTYDGNAHYVISATVSGVDGADLGNATVKYKQGATTVEEPTDAGAYAVTASYAATTNYTAATETGTLTINKAKATILVNDYNGTYDGDAHGATGSATGVKGEDLSSLLNLGSKFINVPGGTADWSFAGNTNYKVASGTAAIIINKASQTIIVTKGAPESAVYNTTFTVAATASSGLAVSYGSDGTLSNSGATYTMNAGTGSGTVSYSQAGNENYKAATVITEIVNAEKASQSITFTSLAAKTYGDASFTLGATASSGLAVSYASSNKSVATVSGNTITIVGAGTTTITARQDGNANYEAATDVLHDLTVAKALLTITANNIATPTQYSDILPAFGYTISGFVNGDDSKVVSGQPAFKTDALLSSIRAVLSPAGTYNIIPDVKPMSAANYSFIASTSDYGSFKVTEEDADVVYSGLEFFATANSLSKVANVEYIATLTDNNDGSNSRGDIVKAKVAFMQGSTTLFSGLPVKLLNSSDPTVGVARSGVNSVDIGSDFNKGGSTIELLTVVEGGYYAGQVKDATLITIAVPGKDYVNGGGHLLVANSSGTYAAPANSKVNFGFTMKWNKSGKNIQGQANIIFRRVDDNGILKTYQIKSNAINTLGTASVTGGRRADFNTKANLRDVTNPANPVIIVGSLDLTVQAFESTSGGKDQISVTLRSVSGELMFSTNWMGGKSVMKDLNGGNIRVLSSTSIASVTSTSLRKKLEVADAVSPSTQFYNYPNTFSDRTTIAFSVEKEQNFALEVYDVRGALVKKIDMGVAKAGQMYEYELDGRHVAEGLYFARLSTNAGVQTIKMLLKKQ